uniref:Uncharacterized protein n=1 Tax=Oryza rufipogon TaxID=4529 RepID=A0A0E0PXY5_ORYRU
MQSGDDAWWFIGRSATTAWWFIGRSSSSLLVYENFINHGRGFRASGRNLEANRPTMAAAHTDPRSTMVSSQSITATTSGRNAYCTMSMVI